MISDIRKEIERAIIGQVCWNSHAFFVASNYLTAGSFSAHKYRYIWRICDSIAREFIPLDIVTIKSRIHEPHLAKDSFWMSRVDLLLEIDTAADPRILRTERLPYHCMLLVEMGIRDYLYMQSLSVDTSTPGQYIDDFRTFQAHLQLQQGHNDLFTLLDRAQTYFRPLPQLVKRISACMHIISQKADRIKSRHGLQMIQETFNHYQRYENQA